MAKQSKNNKESRVFQRITYHERCTIETRTASTESLYRILLASLNDPLLPSAEKSTGSHESVWGNILPTERKGRFGIFYSCTGYPDCKNAIKAKPTGKICEMCGSLMMEGTKTIPERCSNKTCPNHNPHKLTKVNN